MRSTGLALAALLLTVLGPVGVAGAQEKEDIPCGTMVRLRSLIEKDASAAFRLVEFERSVALGAEASRWFPERATVRWVPVVVHLVYFEEKANLPDERVLSQIRVLNEDFRRMPGTRGFNAHPVGADPLIQVRLAAVDPEGRPTTGITRRRTEKRLFHYEDEREAVKHRELHGVDAWDTRRYLNLWVCDLVGAKGYAQFPGQQRPATDGIVIDYRYFGETPEGGSAGANRLGRIATHEVAHWLGLHHLWGDGDDNANCQFDDHVEDTPRQDGPRQGRGPPGAFSCGSPDQIENHLNWTDDDVKNLFTRGQLRRMNTVLAGWRARVHESRPWSGTDVTLRVRECCPGSSRVLTFGLEDRATDGEDLALGEVGLSPVGPDVTFDARFLLGDPGTGTFADLRSPRPGRATWRLSLRSGADHELRLEWDRSALPPGEVRMRSPDAGIDDLDMRRTDSVRLPGGEHEVRIEWTLEAPLLEGDFELVERLGWLRRENERLRLDLEEAEK